jgi:hypothetical protein
VVHPRHQHQPAGVVGVIHEQHAAQGQVAHLYGARGVGGVVGCINQGINMSVNGHAEFQQQAAVTAAGGGDGSGGRQEPPLHAPPTYLMLPFQQPWVHIEHTGACKPPPLHRTPNPPHHQPAEAANQPDTHKRPAGRAAGNHADRAGTKVANWLQSRFQTAFGGGGTVLQRRPQTAWRQPKVLLGQPGQLFGCEMAWKQRNRRGSLTLRRGGAATLSGWGCGGGC